MRLPLRRWWRRRRWGSCDFLKLVVEHDLVRVRWDRGQFRSWLWLGYDARLLRTLRFSSSLRDRHLVQVPDSAVVESNALHLLERAVPESGLEAAVKVRGEPPCGFERVEEVHEGRGAERALADVVAEVGFTAEEGPRVPVVLDALGPVVGEEHGWRRELCRRKRIRVK